MKAIQRWPIVGAVGALLLGAILLDRVPGTLPPQLVAADAPAVRAAINEPLPLTASWYCAIGSTAPGGYADHVIHVSNVSGDVATASVSVLTDEGPGSTLRLELAPYTNETIDLSRVDSSDAAGAVVEVVGGNAVVGHDVTTRHGTASTPCATTVNGRWYFASGSTRRDSAQYLALMNPFGEDVVLDVTFRTATRERRPEDLSDYVVPGRSVRVINVSDFVSIEAVVATTVNAVQGRVVAEQLQVANGDLGPEGAALVLGTPAAATSWVMPAGRVSAEGDHQLVIQNPGQEQAELELYFDLATTDRRTVYGLTSIDLTVQPERFESLDVAELVRALQIPLPLEFGLRVESANGVPVVVSRSQLHPLVDTSLVGAEDSGATVEVAGADEDGGEATADGDDAAVTIDPSTIERRDPLGGSVIRQDGEPGDEDQEDIPLDELIPDVSLVVLDDSSQPTATSGIGVSNGSSAVASTWVVPYTEFLPDGGTVILITASEDALVSIQGMANGDLLAPERVAVDGETRRVVPIVLPVPRSALVITSDSPISIEIQTVDEGRLQLSAAVPVLAR